jgi:hypothetical protein
MQQLMYEYWYPWGVPNSKGHVCRHLQSIGMYGSVSHLVEVVMDIYSIFCTCKSDSGRCVVFGFLEFNFAKNSHDVCQQPTLRVCASCSVSRRLTCLCLVQYVGHVQSSGERSVQSCTCLGFSGFVSPTCRTWGAYGVRWRAIAVQCECNRYDLRASFVQFLCHGSLLISWIAIYILVGILVD